MLKTSLSSTCIFCIFLFVYDYQISSVQASIRVKNSQPCALYSKNNRDLKAKDIKEHLTRKSRLSHHGHHDHNKVIIKPSTPATAGTKHVTVHHFNQKDSKDSYLDWKKRHIGFESYAKRLNLTLVNGTEISKPEAICATITSRTVKEHKTTTYKNFITANDTEEDNELGITSKNDVSIFGSNTVDVLKRNQEVLPLNLAAAITIKPRNDIPQTTLSLEQQCKIQNDQLQAQRSAINQNIPNGEIVSNIQIKPMESIQPVLIKNTPQRLQGDRQIIPGTQEWNERVQEAHVAQAVQDAERATMHSINKYNQFTKLPQISKNVNQVKGVTDLVKSFSEVPADPNKLAPRTVLTKIFIIPIQEEVNDNVQSALRTANQVLDKNTKRSELKNKNKIDNAIENKKHDMEHLTTPQQRSDKESKRKISVSDHKKIAPAPRKEKSVSKKKPKGKVHHTKKKVLHSSNRSNKHKKPAPRKKTHHGSEHKRKKYRKHKDKKTHKHKKKKKPHRKHKEEEYEEEDDEDDDVDVDDDEEDS